MTSEPNYEPEQDDPFRSDPFPTKVVGGVIAGIGVCCAGYAVVLAGGFAVVFGNPLVIAVVVGLAVVVAAAIGVRCLRRGSGDEADLD